MKTLAYWGYATAWFLVRHMPEKAAYGVARFAADQIYRRGGKQIDRLRSNYTRVRPELSGEDLEKLVREGMRSYLRYWCDTFRLPSWSPTKISSEVITENEHFLTDPVDEGRGCVVSLPHAGNWDHAGAYFCSKGYKVVTVAEHLEPEKLFRKFLSYREKIGMEVLDASARSLGVLSQRLRAGGLVALVADRDLSRSGVNVEFFGYPSRMPIGPAILSIQTGAPLITAFVSYEPKGIRIVFQKAIEVPDNGTQSEKAAAMIQESAKRFEDHIRERTVDWHMLQRIWIDGDFVERAV
jgi:phosphatidylinositol dimannoside acyltransferase